MYFQNCEKNITFILSRKSFQESLFSHKNFLIFPSVVPCVTTEKFVYNYHCLILFWRICLKIPAYYLLAFAALLIVIIIISYRLSFSLLCYALGSCSFTRHFNLPLMLNNVEGLVHIFSYQWFACTLFRHQSVSLSRFSHWFINDTMDMAFAFIWCTIYMIYTFMLCGDMGLVCLK